MRDILFRAKTEPNCKDVITGKIIKKPKWIYGYIDLGYMHDGRAPLISDEKGNKTYKCQYETIGQFTGLTDKNGKKIFEGDIIQIPDDYNEFGHNAGEIYEVYFCCGGFRLKPKYSKARGYWLEDDRTVEVVGNVFDNSELLKGGAENEQTD